MSTHAEVETQFDHYDDRKRPCPIANKILKSTEKALLSPFQKNPFFCLTITFYGGETFRKTLQCLIISISIQLDYKSPNLKKSEKGLLKAFNRT